VKPLVVLVSGVPGGGKTTLARQLADELRLPHLNKDIIRDGVWFTTRGSLDPNRVAFPLWLGAIETWLNAGVSLVADQTLYRGVSERDVGRAVSHGTGVNVVVRTPLARDRFQAKMAADPRNEGRVPALMARWDEIVDDVSEPLALGLPIVEVETSNPVDVAALAARVVAAASGPDKWV
jgi:predicted kinase